jgi:putative flavoprotein involved in K+ transport
VTGGEQQEISRTAGNTRDERVSAIVVGGGPAGLATAAELKRRGVDAVVLEQGRRPGAAWEGHYDRLRLNTVRWLSHLPGYRLPRRYGRWVSRDDMLRYLADYAQRHRLDIRTDTEATDIGRDDDDWVVVAGEACFRAPALVIATGYCRVPRMPAWAGMKDYERPLLHTSSYQNAIPFQEQNVLVVGAGNSGADIAIDLAEGGANEVMVSARTPPQVVPRTVFKVPTILVAVVTRRLPPVIGDSIVAFLQRRTVGDLSAHGCAQPTTAVTGEYRRRDVIPTSSPRFATLVRSGRIKLVSAVDHLASDRVILVDGVTVTPDAIIAATGYDRKLDELLGGLNVLLDNDLPTIHGEEASSRAPGLHFIGYTNPLSGNLRELRIDARRIAKRTSTAATAPRRVTARTSTASLIHDGQGTP